MKPNRLLTPPIFFVGVCLFLAASLSGEEPCSCHGPLIVVFRDGSSVYASSSDTVGLQPNQSVMTIAQYPPTSIGHRITAAPLDGGRMIGPTSQTVDDPSATVQFQFQADADPSTQWLSPKSPSRKCPLFS